MGEVVEEGRTGLLFTPGDAADLAAKVEWARSHPLEMAEMGRAARHKFEAEYTAPRNLELLVGVYHRAIGAQRQEQPRPSGHAGALIDEATPLRHR